MYSDECSMWWVYTGMLGALTLHAGAGEPPARAPRCLSSHCRYISGGFNEYQYSVTNQTIIISVSDGDYLHVECYGADVLTSNALPSASERLRVHRVTLSACPLPASGSLQDTLRALNATLECGAPLTSCGLSLERLPATPTLTARHLAGLPDLTALKLAASRDARASPERGFLTALPTLTELTMLYVTLPTDELEEAPANLTSLELRYAGLERVSRMQRHALSSLIVENKGPLEVSELPPTLQALELASESTAFQLEGLALLENLTLGMWKETHPVKMQNCGALHLLQLIKPALETLPRGWLANCVHLRFLALLDADRLRVLHPDLLFGASVLRSLTISTGGLLEILPQNLLDYTPNLEDLQLPDNGFQNLPSGIFRNSQLQILDLSDNNLDVSALDSLNQLTLLKELNLARNKRIDDLCDTIGQSRIHAAANLTTLDLSGTGVTRICRDWREGMKHLELLNLQHTEVSELWFEELLFERDASVVNARVLLQGAPLEAVVLRRVDYVRFATSAPGARKETVYIDAKLACDCRMYWSRRAVQHLGHVHELRCANGRLLRDVPPEEMLCRGTDKCTRFHDIPRTCTTQWRPDDEPASKRPLVRLRCEGAGLRHLPAPEPSRDHHVPCRYEMLLANNTINRLSAADLYDEIKGLDLRNNSLREVNRETAVRLGRVEGMLRLAHNEFDCSCKSALLLRELQKRYDNSDLSNMTCSGGSPLAAAAAVECALPEPRGARLTVWLASGLAVLLALALAAIVALASRERRFFLKVVLYRWGCLWRPAEPREDRTRPYDAFVTFAHEDEAVACEVVQRLEPPYRLCVHYRDWVPGQLISEQIAESVERSRRTIALVSRHFLSSTWAQIEFREAHATALRDSSHRLVVVLLEEPQHLTLEPTLRRYLETNTYVRWGDRWFWDKLIVALPAPCTSLAAASVLVTASPASVAPSFSSVDLPSKISCPILSSTASYVSFKTPKKVPCLEAAESSICPTDLPLS